MLKIDNDWKSFVENEKQKPYFVQLENFLKEESNSYQIYPEKNSILNALKLTSLESVRIVIIGQDPYHQPNQANGLAFSVNDGTPLPPSLKNIFKEIESQFKTKTHSSGNLERWAKQGVLLLNTVLTVRKDCPNSHQNKGWETFTRKVLQTLCQKNQPLVFLLWGKNAMAFESLIQNKKHLVLKSVHPSPLSAHRGFFGNNHFILANKFLKANSFKEIDWR